MLTCALVSVHDRVANKEYPAVYSTAAQGSPPSLDEESVTRVRIDKQKDPLIMIQSLQDCLQGMEQQQQSSNASKRYTGLPEVVWEEEEEGEST
ncbi:hypothetical protein GBAR_LOCUS23387 [Geodia barretti]|uniref:Uncharacterized protein n=1 Tax=Geodia barretti TaxID=519541 RepID=A0AA35T6E1_GEOBA|nr:hypothetical protein GBAR_LOCUS23387 [Geodia barretti]